MKHIPCKDRNGFQDKFDENMKKALLMMIMMLVKLMVMMMVMMIVDMVETDAYSMRLINDGQPVPNWTQNCLIQLSVMAGQTDGQMDGHTALKRCMDASKNPGKRHR